MIGGGFVTTLESYPESCQWSIQTVADKLKIGYDEAYALITLNALLMDLYPSDTVVVRTILEDVERAKQSNKNHVDQVQH